MQDQVSQIEIKVEEWKEMLVKWKIKANWKMEAVEEKVLVTLEGNRKLGSFKKGF